MKGNNNWKVVILITVVLLSLTGGQVFATVAPSVSANAAPVVVGAATFTDANGNAITIPAAEITITPDAQTGTLSPEQKAVYDEAKAQFTNPNSQYNKDLGDFLTKNYPEVAADKVVVREIFDIKANQDLKFDNGQKLEVTLSGNYKPGDTVIVTIYNKDIGKWDFIASTDVKVNADGSITVKFPHLSPAAILIADAGSATAATTVDSNTSMLIPVLVVGAVILAVVLVALKKKKSV